MDIAVEVKEKAENPVKMRLDRAVAGDVGRDDNGNIFVRMNGGATELRKTNVGYTPISWSVNDHSIESIVFTPDPGLRARIIIERV